MNLAPETDDLLWTKTPDWDCPQCGWRNIGIRERCRNFHCGFDSALVSGGRYFPVVAKPAPVSGKGEKT